MPGMRYQPQGLVRVNRALPWAADIAFLLLPQNRMSLPRPFQAATGVGLNVPTPNGVAYSHTGPTTVQTYATGAIGNLDGTDFTVIVALDQIGNTASYRGLVGKRDGASSSDSWSLFVDSGRRLTFAAGGSDRVLGTISVTDRDGAMYAVTGSISTGQLTGYQDGEILGAAALQGNVTGASNSIRLGVIRGNALGENFTGRYRFVAVVRRALAPAEIRSLYQNLWQVFAEDEDYWIQDGATSYALSVASAALSTAGGQAGMRVARRLRATPAGLSVTAGQVALRAARRMRVQPATVAMLAGPVRLLVSRRFGMKPAALAVAGQGVTLRAGRRMQVAPVSLAIAGGQVAMQYSPALVPGAYTLPVSAAGMTLGGGIVGMRVTRRLPVEPAVIVIEGQQVSFLLGGRAGEIDATKVPPSRTVKFAGGKRVAIFSGGVRVATFNGGKRTVRF